MEFWTILRIIGWFYLGVIMISGVLALRSKLSGWAPIILVILPFAMIFLCLTLLLLLPVGSKISVDATNYLPGRKTLSNLCNFGFNPNGRKSWL